ncbi:hypothetical protein CPB83DRAFT_113095 [Crepidotus variabilis]|uniref:Nephrocystin 3-like N-terminal domain-containing protein n=1 Tax=Crepidotus variabilis TaxID=179855 RepID=A0A9P6JIU3_9AGAR|nr:hypothetical protein CPB83DRAFT_113095 [Crepidotus variabilis]
MAEPPHSLFFHNAHNISVIDSTITSTVHNHESRSSGIHLLSQKISTSAMHDSSARDPPPRCHPDTRKRALDTIGTFVDDPEPHEVVIWMNAPFGHGKSAVMQTVIEILRASGRGHRVAGGFFFGRDKPGRDKAHYLLPTILYQIAHNVPGMYEHVNDAINADPTLPSKSIEAQLIPLLIMPFRNYAPSSTHTPTVFIDGLDECDAPAAQRSVLKMIADAVSVHHIPLRFVVASRPEVHINQFFKTSPLSSITRSFELDDDSASMESYFHNEFDRIYEARVDDMSAIAKPWPTDKIVWDLVRRASGQYLFASTVIRFVGDEYDHPLEQLQVILAPHPRQYSAFSSMDTLYAQILSACPIRLRTCLLNILAMVASYRDGRVCIASLCDLLDLAPLDVSTAIRSLRAILDIRDLPTLPPHSTDFCLSKYLSPTITIRHISLEEFLTDKARARDFWIDLDTLKMMLLRRSDIILASSISDSAGLITIHPLTWRCLLWPRMPVEPGKRHHSSWPKSWPLFIREFSKYRDADAMQSQVTGWSLQKSKAFCFLLSHWNNSRRFQADIASNEDFQMTQYIVSTSLRQWFDPLSSRSLDLFALFAYFHNTETSLAANLEAINERSDISFHAALRAIESADIFLQLDNGNPTRQEECSARDVRVCVDWSIIDILTDPKLIGEDIYIAYRNAQLLALSCCYNNFLIEESLSLDSFRKKSLSVFSYPMLREDILMLHDNIDDGNVSTMGALITQICSPRSLAVLCNTAAFDENAHYFFTPFFLFITMNCLQGPLDHVSRASTASFRT